MKENKKEKKEKEKKESGRTYLAHLSFPLFPSLFLFSQTRMGRPTSVAAAAGARRLLGRFDRSTSGERFVFVLFKLSPIQTSISLSRRLQIQIRLFCLVPYYK